MNEKCHQSIVLQSSAKDSGSTKLQDLYFGAPTCFDLHSARHSLRCPLTLPRQDVTTPCEQVDVPSMCVFSEEIAPPIQSNDNHIDEREMAMWRSFSFQPHLKMVFWSNGEPHPVSFTQKPLGLTFRAGGESQSLPIVVNSSNHLAVQPGWVLVSVNDKNISDSGMTYDQMVKNLQGLARDLPLDSNFMKELKVIFESNGEEHPVSFKQKPLGLRFRPGCHPPVVDNVCGHAERLGVQPGWVMKSINNVEIANMHPSETSDLRTFINHYMQHLDDSG